MYGVYFQITSSPYFGTSYSVYDLSTENRSRYNYVVISPTVIGNDNNDKKYTQSFDCQPRENSVFDVLDYSLIWKNTDIEDTNDDNTYIRPLEYNYYHYGYETDLKEIKTDKVFYFNSIKLSTEFFREDTEEYYIHQCMTITNGNINVQNIELDEDCELTVHSLEI